MKSELDLFSIPPIQTSVIATEQVVYNPITSLDNTSNIDFLIPGNGDTYKNLASLYLRLVLQINPVQKDEKKLAGPVNNILHSVFRQCTVFLNNIQVSQDNNYHYKAFLTTILNYGGDAAKTHLVNTGWSLDFGKISSLIPKENPALDERKIWFKDGKKVEVIGKLHIDFFNQPKFLTNNVDIKISFTREKDSFCLMEPSTENSSLKILEANIFADQVHLNPQLLLAHHKILQSGHTAKYPFKRNLIRQFTLNTNTYSLNLDNVVIGQIPNVIVFAMVNNAAYTGAKEKNPFCFEHFNLTNFALFVNGKQIPGKPLKFSYSTVEGNQTSRGYQTLFKGTGINYFDRGHQITKKLFDDSYFLLVHDLTPDHSHSSDCMNPIQQGTIRIEGTFDKPLTETVTCLLLCEFDAMVEVDYLKNVKISF